MSFTKISFHTLCLQETTSTSNSEILQYKNSIHAFLFIKLKLKIILVSTPYFMTQEELYLKFANYFFKNCILLAIWNYKLKIRTSDDDRVAIKIFIMSN